jgi:oligopeptide transport system substrate-binding protein
MNRKKILMLLGILVVASMVLVACQPAETSDVPAAADDSSAAADDSAAEAPAAEEEMDAGPVTLHVNWNSEPTTADPSLATDTTSVAIVGNIFISLTRFHPVSGEVIPYLATSWESGTDADGKQTWTFSLRSDVPWVHFNPSTGEFAQSVDDDGNPRFVNAHDVVYGVQRTVNPDTASDYSYVLYAIDGAVEINSGDEGTSVANLGVTALDDSTVQFTLRNPAGYFPAIAGMWIAMPMPSWAIDQWGDEWTEPGLIDTSGPYAMELWIHGSELNLIKNTLFPEADTVQIERISGVMIQETSTAFALYENGELDTTPAPLGEIDRIKADANLFAEYVSVPIPCTYYYGFTNNKPPFDDARVRRAFSQAIDRQSLIDNVLKGAQVPATTFAPPGMFGAPVPGTTGLGTDAAGAQADLQSYLDDNGMTIDDFNALGVTLMHNTSEGHASIAAAIQQMWSDTLGVEVTVENQEWAVYLTTIKNDSPLEDMPHIWRFGWCADYPDENNWIHEVFNADEGANRLRRESGDFDALTAAAGSAGDPSERAALYDQAENMLASEIAGYAPIYHYAYAAMTHTWLTRDFPPLGAPNYYEWTIDQDAQQAMMGN